MHGYLDYMLTLSGMMGSGMDVSDSPMDTTVTIYDGHGDHKLSEGVEMRAPDT